MDRAREVGVRLHRLVEHNLRNFGSRIPFIRSLAASSKLWHAKNTAVNRELGFLDKKGRQCEIPLSWTELAAKDPGTILASRKSWFRAADLVELALSRRTAT